METVFDVDLTGLAESPRFAVLADALRAHTRIDSALSFNAFCAAACRGGRKKRGEDAAPMGSLFGEMLAKIMGSGEGVIRTAWGGVVVTLQEPPRVEKYLVVRAGAFLALERHAEKDEHLEVREGAGLVLFRAGAEPVLKAQMVGPGDRFHFLPGTEHCLIGLDNLLVFEQSVDPKGMDQDLIFLYEPDVSRFGDGRV